MRKYFIFLFFIFIFVIVSSTRLWPELDFHQWQSRFKTTLQSGKIEKIQRFFAPGFAEKELETWKYQIQRGFLDFNSTTVIPLTKDSLLLYIATDSSPYSGENAEKYFDFIYRIYRVEAVSQSTSTDSSAGLAITARCMDDFNPDFLTCDETLEFFPSSRTMSVISEIKANLKSDRLIFKLAKEFQIKSLTINGENHPFQRLGYFVTAKVADPIPVTFRVNGTITAVSDHNQFFCIDDINFFLRSGGFAATPSPPPDNRGRPYYSSDEAEFSRIIRFPSHYKILFYGKIVNDETREAKRSVTLWMTEKYLDGLSIYAQADWNITSIQRGNVSAGFYFPAGNQREQDFLETEIHSLLDWLYRFFKKDSNSTFAINFVVLDKFVKSGLLNDGTSIIASKASIIGSGGGGYIHELCHIAPQPYIEGNVLWVKEGFTNYLSFNFLRDIKGENDFWKHQKRRYLHRFGLYCEPLAVITHKGIPCYWSVYQKGPWIYRMLETQLGNAHFDNAMAAIGKREGETIAHTKDYFNIFETVSGKDLTTFRRQWLERKQNPVLRVRHKVIPPGKTRDGNTLFIQVSQEEPVFHFPLDIEIKTEKQTLRRTLQLDAPVKKMALPINSRLVSVRCDPDARVFAVIKDGTSSFVNPSQLRTPLRDDRYRFESGKDKHIVEFQIKTGSRGFDIFRRKGKEELHLELGRGLSPRAFYREGKKIYSIDIAAGKIHLPGAEYDIAEPVYPSPFAIALVSMVDWEKTREESFVGLRKSGYSSSVITAVREQGVVNGCTLIRIGGFRFPVKLFLRNGRPVKYTAGNEGNAETFTLVDI